MAINALVLSSRGRKKSTAAASATGLGRGAAAARSAPSTDDSASAFKQYFRFIFPTEAPPLPALAPAFPGMPAPVAAHPDFISSCHATATLSPQFAAEMHSAPATAAPPASASLPRGVVTGVFLRPPDASGSTCFERRPHAQGVPAAIGLFGLEGSREWHRLEQHAGRLSSTDAADRALLMQVMGTRQLSARAAKCLRSPRSLTCAILSVSCAHPKAAANADWPPRGSSCAGGRGSRGLWGKFAG